MIARIFADLNRRPVDSSGEKVHIGQEGTWQIEQYPLKTQLYSGQLVKLYDDELEVEATLEFDEANQVWYGRPKWSTKRELSSRVDGWEEYASASPTVRLKILRYVLKPLIDAIYSNAQLLTRKHQGTADTVLLDEDQLLKSMVELTHDLRNIFELLAGNEASNQDEAVFN